MNAIDEIQNIKTKILNQCGIPIKAKILFIGDINSLPGKNLYLTVKELFKNRIDIKFTVTKDNLNNYRLPCIVVIENNKITQVLENYSPDVVKLRLKYL